MRLTLRTMLAYLDDVLDPADAEVLGARISENEFASELVHRIRSSTRKMRLAAPEMDQEGVGVELNSVAEYLDNVLPENELADFERVCLESDLHLAEVASCHQILTLVLGEPAMVDDEIRQRVYRVEAKQQVADQAPQVEAPAVPGPPPVVVDPPPLVTAAAMMSAYRWARTASVPMATPKMLVIMIRKNTIMPAMDAFGWL